MEDSRFYIISTLIALFCLLMILSVSGCRAHHDSETDGVMTELQRTPQDTQKGGVKL